MLGNAVGIAAQVTLVAVGLSVVVEQSVLAFTLIKLVGAAYLIWLGIRAVCQRGSRSAAALVGTRCRYRQAVVHRAGSPNSRPLAD